MKCGVRPVLTVADLEQIMALCLGFPARKAGTAALTPSSQGAGGRRALLRTRYLRPRLWHLGAVVTVAPMGVLLV